ADQRDVQRRPVGIAEGDVGRMVARCLDAYDRLARRVVHPDSAGRRAPDVALHVAFHAVGNAAFGARIAVEDARAAHRTVGVHVIGSDQPFAAAVHVQDFFVGRKAQTVGIDVVLAYRAQRLAVGRDAKYRLGVEVALNVG